jgi:hypothetical protein
MKNKDSLYFKRKRKDLKKRKRQLKDIDFVSSKERKKAKDELKREYRSHKRSEKQQLQKQIERDLDE